MAGGGGGGGGGGVGGSCDEARCPAAAANINRQFKTLDGSAALNGGVWFAVIGCRPHAELHGIISPARPSLRIEEYPTYALELMK